MYSDELYEPILIQKFIYFNACVEQCTDFTHGLFCLVAYIDILPPKCWNYCSTILVFTRV